MPRSKLIPLKVIIRNSPQKSAIFPDWSKIDPELMYGMPAEVYFERIGLGVHYDRTEHIDYCMIFVEKSFAVKAIELFPDLVTALSESECSDYWDNQAHAHEADIVDIKALQAIKLKKDLGVPTPEEKDALDPLKPHPGIKKNWKRKWREFKEKYNIELDKL